MNFKEVFVTFWQFLFTDFKDEDEYQEGWRLVKAHCKNELKTKGQRLKELDDCLTDLLPEMNEKTWRLWLAEEKIKLYEDRLESIAKDVWSGHSCAAVAEQILEEAKQFSQEEEGGWNE